MNTRRQTLQRNFFRAINSVVEPSVKRGVFSPACAPAGLIILESTGHKSGVTRSTPLLASHFGRYTLVSTVRGEQSFWVKNLRNKAAIRFYKGGSVREATAQVFMSSDSNAETESLPRPLALLIDGLLRRGADGLALAVLRTDAH